MWKILRQFRQHIAFRGRCHFEKGVIVGRGTILEGMNSIGGDTKFRGTLGFGSYVGTHCELAAEIGRFTSIAPGVKCNPGQHPYKTPYASTSPLFFQASHSAGSFVTEDTFPILRLAVPKKGFAVCIGNDCWIGQEAFLVGGITIADGAVVLARAVVTKDVPPYAIVGGVPARIVGYRYDADTIDKLLRIKWWNRDTEWLKMHINLFQNVDKLLNEVDK